jgi:hypothetical protein
VRVKPVTVVAPYKPGFFLEKTLPSLMSSPLIEDVLLLGQEPLPVPPARCHILAAGPLASEETLRQLLYAVRTEYLLLLPDGRPVELKSGALGRMLEVAGTTKAGLVYSDFYDLKEGEKTLHPLIDYQPGSVRDTFDFGPLILFSMAGLHQAVKKHGMVAGVQWAGLYDLRLKVSIEHPVHHVPEPLYAAVPTDEDSNEERLFAYVDPRNLAYQKEMEAVFTGYLNKIGAWLPASRLREVGEPQAAFPAEASVVIPVRNRRGTIVEAVKSALSQETTFPFNVVVVDNHSTDGTTALLSDLGSKYRALTHIVPTRTDLAIGGCWNEALQSDACGRYAVQLDSDDLYVSPHTLQRMVDTLREGRLAMVVGSYTLVDSRLEEISPGLVDHREWTDENGHNNALRINGLGAPRAFYAPLMRSLGFLNVSYGEDYGAALRICREYRIGRIFESLYLCRRWSGNTDAALSLEEANRNDAFKDGIRTAEILARQQMNKGDDR